MLNKDDLFLSALSGGADSTAMLLMLLEKGYKVEAVHCNFHLRGEESDRDENFCRKLCEKNNVKLHIVHFDTVSYSQLHHQSIETAARNLRYNYFFNLAHDIGAKGICIAHNQNDQAETILMNLVRGAGIHGLEGIRPVNHVNFHGEDLLVVRPILNLSRDEIVDYLKNRNQDWVTDSTNLSTDATRNKFRLEIIPQLKKINPSAMVNMAQACSRLQQVTRIYDHYIDESVNNIVSGDKVLKIDIKGLNKTISPEAVLYEIMSRYGFNGRQSGEVFSHINSSENIGKAWKSSSHQLVIDRNDILIAPLDEKDDFSFKIPETGNYRLPNDTKIRIQEEPWSNASVISKDCNNICLDAEGISFPLIVRTVKTGDRFVPFGMKGSKLVSDFLTDLKVSLIEKQKQLVLCDASGKILWVIGKRPDNRFRIGKSTSKALRISLE